MIENKVFLSHASEDKSILECKLISCLNTEGISYWYDKEQIYAGHDIVKKINDGLSSTKIGIILFSKNYLIKNWTVWEMMVLVYLLITHKVRLIPFLLNDITVDEILEKFIILAPLKFERLPSCDKIISLVNEKFTVYDNILKDDGVSKSSYYYFLDDGVNPNQNENPQNPNEKFVLSNEIQNDLKIIFSDLQSNVKDVLKEITITKIKNFSEIDGIYNYPFWWKILESLIFSNDDCDIKDGIYSLLEMLKRTKLQAVKSKANELFGHKIMASLEDNDSTTISEDSLNILGLILEENQFFSICLLGLIDAIKRIDDENKYTNYIQRFIMRIEKGNKEQKKTLCKYMDSIIRSKDELHKTKTRAKYIFIGYHKSTL